MTALIDTCVILDALQERKPFDTNAKEIIDMVAQKNIEGFITAKSITDIYYIYMRSTHNKDKTIDAIKNCFPCLLLLILWRKIAIRLVFLTLRIMKTPLWSRRQLEYI